MKFGFGLPVFWLLLDGEGVMPRWIDLGQIKNDMAEYA